MVVHLGRSGKVIVSQPFPAGFLDGGKPRVVRSQCDGRPVSDNDTGVIYRAAYTAK